MAQRILARHQVRTFLLLGAALVAFPLQAQEYQVRAGDTLMDIARAQLGSAARWRELCEINRDRLDDCNLILTGMTLRLAPSPPEPSRAEPDPSAPVAPERISEPEATGAQPAPVDPAPVSPPEPATAENHLPNDSLRGAVPGTIGDGGQLPDDWFFFTQGDAQASIAILEISDEWLDVEIAQTGDSGIVFLGFTRRGGFVATQPGQVWTLAVEMAVLQDDASGAWRANLQGSQWAAQDASSSLGAFVFAADLPLGPDLQQFLGSAVMTHPDVNYFQADIRFVSTGPWTATFRIGIPSVVAEPR